MAVNDDETVLPCGRDLGSLWERLDQPPDGHERGCSFCQQARARARHVSSMTAAMVRRDEADPDMRIGAAVKGAVLEIARAEIRRSRMIPLERPVAGESEPGLTISELVVSDVARAVADTIPGVRIRHCEAEYLEQSPGDVEGLPARIGLTVVAAVSASAQIPSLLPRLRDRIREVTDQEVGLDVAAINITVEDVYDA